jgi:hypothetical protein
MRASAMDQLDSIFKGVILINKTVCLKVIIMLRFS